MLKKEVTIEDVISLTRGNPILAELAEKYAIDELTLRAKSLLGLPHITTPERLPSEKEFAAEIRKIAEKVAVLQRPYRQWLKKPTNVPPVRDLQFIELDEERARIFHERFHYVGDRKSVV